MLGFLAATIMQAAPLEYASHDDCAIIVAVGKSKAGWGKDGPNQAFVIDGPEPDGSIYREDCDWRSLGVGDPRAPEPNEARFAIGRPAYSADGKEASVELNFVVPRVNDAAPFIEVQTCKLQKRGRQWRLIRCDVDAIT